MGKTVLLGDPSNGWGKGLAKIKDMIKTMKMCISVDLFKQSKEKFAVVDLESPSKESHLLEVHSAIKKYLTR